jgi:hypothetical protein
MAKLPKIVGLTLCDHIEVDPQSGHFSLMGIFHSRRFRQFPSPVVRFTVYTALYGGQGEGTIELVINQAETEKDIYRLQKWLSFPDRQLINLELKVTRCVFPEPGNYLVGLRFDKRNLTNRTLIIGRE